MVLGLCWLSPPAPRRAHHHGLCGPAWLLLVCSHPQVPTGGAGCPGAGALGKAGWLSERTEVQAGSQPGPTWPNLALVNLACRLQALLQSLSLAVPSRCPNSHLL